MKTTDVRRPDMRDPQGEVTWRPAVGPLGVTPPLRDVAAQLNRIEGKLDRLLQALAEEAEGPTHTLDGDPLPMDREEGEPL